MGWKLIGDQNRLLDLKALRIIGINLFRSQKFVNTLQLRPSITSTFLRDLRQRPPPPGPLRVLLSSPNPPPPLPLAK
ncbi:hypothetical protein L596_007080 [Steinernema carpocapsae]|uniref:Uncharacterized protein n=1 Tax=Steinernema carpocapsae TaxID=34508 RepID=A0A4U5P846_STECR|nr:hypothetical protein L596_007080 [Steinernema carpocapsae]